MRKYVFTSVIIMLAVGCISGGTLFLVARHSHDTQQKAARTAAKAKITCHMKGNLPDATCTPGAISVAVTSDNVQQTICHGDYARRLLPPAAYLQQLKQQQLVAYGFQDANKYTEDLLIPVSLGGSPLNPKNFWLAPNASAERKQAINTKLHDAVCSGRLGIDDAQTRITKDWTTAAQGLD